MCAYTFVRGYLAFPYVTFGLFPPGRERVRRKSPEKVFGS